jgi:hypothetical protein
MPKKDGRHFYKVTAVQEVVDWLLNLMLHDLMTYAIGKNCCSQSSKF